MPRSGSRSRSKSGSSSPSRSHVPATVPPKKPQQGPGLGKQAAAVAGGVVAGNMLSAALFGPRVIETDGSRKEVEDPCAKELFNFVECANNTSDMRDCEGLNEVLKQCRKKYGNALKFNQSQE
ncbi:unnamed protein product [Allacma fusca]|uniref:CHCH domain-containing protein n=1 Tax=Allacma fusca TaxID=39272 RepID=A0A8J2LTK9_9HEXA|nr:unnamed protein product [Allacma fusca]